MKLRSGRTFRWLGLLGVLIVPYTLVAQKALPLTQSQACTRFGSAVVRIEAGGNSRGTGFIVSPDGFILTASHVVRDASGQYFAAVAVTLPGGKIKLASPAVPISVDNFGQDFALLKVDADIELPFLSLGSTHDVEPGDAGTIIGYPFSALTAQGQNVSTKFCLSAEIAATDIMNVAVNETRPTAKGNFSAERNVKVDVVYFQGPSVKGLSGSPIIEIGRAHV